MASVHDWTDVEGAAIEAAGNHRKFTSFGWYERPDDDLWTIAYTHNRDSRLLDESNAEAIDKEMEPFLESGDVVAESHGHWACGWVAGYSIRVYRADGTITDAFRKWCEIQEKLEDYPVLDEEAYSAKEHEATLENIASVGRRYLNGEEPEDWECQVFSWFWDNNQRAVENRDDQGGYPDDDDMKDALADLGWLDDDYLEEE
jgi:hypothetical protein